MCTRPSGCRANRGAAAARSWHDRGHDRSEAMHGRRLRDPDKALVRSLSTTRPPTRTTCLDGIAALFRSAARGGDRAPRPASAAAAPFGAGRGGRAGDDADRQGPVLAAGQRGRGRGPGGPAARRAPRLSRSRTGSRRAAANGGGQCAGSGPGSGGRPVPPAPPAAPRSGGFRVRRHHLPGGDQRHRVRVRLASARLPALRLVSARLPAVRLASARVAVLRLAVLRAAVARLPAVRPSGAVGGAEIPSAADPVSKRPEAGPSAAGASSRPGPAHGRQHRRGSARPARAQGR